MKRKLTAGLTGVSLPLHVVDTSSATGAGLSGLAYNTAGLTAEYRRQGQGAWTAITLAAGTLGTWSSGGFVADGTLAGAYELGLPNAATASGARWVIVRLHGAANMAPSLCEIELDSVDYASPWITTTTDVSAAAVAGSAGAALRKANETLDATISSRAATGAAMTLVDGSVTSAKFGTITKGFSGFLERLAMLCYLQMPSGSGKITQPTSPAASGSTRQVYDTDGTTVLVAQPISNDGTTETLGAAS